MRFGYRGGVWADGEVTLLRSSDWNIRLLQGLRPSGYIPACILTSLRDYAFGLWGGKKKTAGVFDGLRLSGKKAATYSPTVRSTIGAFGLNFSVRNGKRWNPGAIATKMSY